MKPFYTRGVAAAVVLVALGRGAMAQDSSITSPSILPLPQSRSVVPTAYQQPSPSVTLSAYRQALVNNQETVDSPPALGSGSDVGSSAAEAAGSAVQNPWMKPWTSSNTSTAGGVPSAMAGNSEAGCLSCNPCCGGGGARWFGSIGGLAMTRNSPNAFWTSANSINIANQTLNTKEAGYGVWGGGGQVTFGRWWCPCCNPCSCGPSYAYGIQFTYWQLGDMNGYASVFDPNGNIITPMNMTAGTPPTFNGAAVDPYFDGAFHQAVWRTNRFLNLELNGLVQPIYNNPGCFSATLLGGFRYFRFQDIVTYGSAKDPSGDFNANGGADAAYLQSNVSNNLFGGQIGTLLNFAVSPRFGLFAMPKFGVFGNQINITNSLYTGNGIYAFNLHASQTVCSLMGEFDTGVYWWMSPNCQLFFGWRVIGVSNVALADNQFLPYISDTAGYQTVKSNGDLILTGGFGGLAFAF